MSAVGVRIGRTNVSAREARLAAWWHIEHGVWLTNKRYDAMRVGVPVIASACGTWLFIRGTVTADPDPWDAGYQWDGDYKYAYPVKFEPTVYLGDNSNAMLDRIASKVRSLKELTDSEFEQAVAGLRPDPKSTPPA
jgi:hypothetical protein